MSSEKDKHNGNDILFESNSSMNKSYQLRLYYVRIHDAKDKLEVQADFGNKIKFLFDKGRQLDQRNSCSPFIYILDLLLKMDNTGQLNVWHEGHWKQIGLYYLEVSRAFVKVGTITYNEKEIQEHTLSDCFENKYHFLFDIQFSPKFNTHLPGKNLRKMTNKNL
jgi:hypothetical protein